MAEEIRMTNTLTIERRRPVATERGKVLAVRPSGTAGLAAEPSNSGVRA
jgi:hypothetical protein